MTRTKQGTTIAMLACISAFCALIPGLALAQGATSVIRPIIPFLEGTDVFLSDEPNLTFEAAIFPHLVAFQNFDNILDARKDADDNKGFWAISGTPAVRTRMFNSESKPVRTPSYMPRVNIQYLYTVDFRCPEDGSYVDPNTATGCADPADGARPTVGLWELHAIIGHHSNGQSGCLFLEQERDAEGCRPSFEGATEPGTVNKKDGSFGTNYVRAGFNWRRSYMALEEGTMPIVFSAVTEFSVGAEYQRQFRTASNLKPFYPDNRLNTRVSLAKKDWIPGCSSRFELTGRATVILDQKTSLVPRYIGSGQLSCFPNTDGGWGLFVRLYRGQDYYNLGFLDDITRVQFGATFNTDGFFRFRPPSR